jgi:hypothetical protein
VQVLISTLTIGEAGPVDKRGLTPNDPYVMHNAGNKIMGTFTTFYELLMNRLERLKSSDPRHFAAGWRDPNDFDSKISQRWLAGSEESMISERLSLFVPGGSAQNNSNVPE